MARPRNPNSEIARKLTLALVAGSSKNWFEKLMQAEDKTLPLARIAGIAYTSKADQTDLGPYLRLGGQFQGVSLLTGEKFSAGVAILPNYLAEQIHAMLQNASTNGVDFAFEFHAVYDPSSVAKYTYKAFPLIEPRHDARMTRLLEATGIAPALTHSESATENTVGEEVAKDETPKEEPKPTKGGRR